MGVLSDAHYNTKWPDNILLFDVRKGLPYQDSFLRYVYSSHFFEHLYADEARAFLLECFRVSKPGGILRLAVPDLEICCRCYWESVSREDLAADNHAPAADILVAESMMAPDAAPQGFVNGILRPLLGRATLHCWNYDAHSLTSRLVQADFVKVGRKGFRESDIPDIECLDLQVHSHRSVYVEGTKPA